MPECVIEFSQDTIDALCGKALEGITLEGTETVTLTIPGVGTVDICPNPVKAVTVGGDLEIDDSDPANPVISYTGAPADGSSSFGMVAADGTIMLPDGSTAPAVTGSGEPIDPDTAVLNVFDGDGNYLGSKICDVTEPVANDDGTIQLTDNCFAPSQKLVRACTGDSYAKGEEVQIFTPAAGCVRHNYGLTVYDSAQLEAVMGADLGTATPVVALERTVQLTNNDPDECDWCYEMSYRDFVTATVQQGQRWVVKWDNGPANSAQWDGTPEESFDTRRNNAGTEIKTFAIQREACGNIPFGQTVTFSVLVELRLFPFVSDAGNRLQIGSGIYTGKVTRASDLNASLLVI